MIDSWLESLNIFYCNRIKFFISNHYCVATLLKCV